jgi:hypothetical protein
MRDVRHSNNTCDRSVVAGNYVRKIRKECAMSRQRLHEKKQPVTFVTKDKDTITQGKRRLSRSC